MMERPYASTPEPEGKPMTFGHDHYLLKRQVLALTGRIRLYASDGTLVGYAEQRMFRLREDIRIYADEQKQRELLWIQARQILDFSAGYDVIDSEQMVKVGALRRKGFRSLLRDHWEILDTEDRLAGGLWEDSAGKAALRRLLLGSLLPQRYDVFIGDRVVAKFAQRFNLLRYEVDLDFSPDISHLLDRRLGLAASVLLGTIEGKQG
jgi:uncharacterized protein YxjI